MKWKITLTPIISLPGDNTQVTWDVTGSVLTVNGEAFDFGPFPDGGRMLPEDIACQYIVGDMVHMTDGVLHITLQQIVPFNNGYENVIVEIES